MRQSQRKPTYLEPVTQTRPCLQIPIKFEFHFIPGVYHYWANFNALNPSKAADMAGRMTSSQPQPVHASNSGCRTAIVSGWC
jgi:hypothetical protein